MQLRPCEQTPLAARLCDETAQRICNNGFQACGDACLPSTAANAAEVEAQAACSTFCCSQFKACLAQRQCALPTITAINCVVAVKVIEAGMDCVDKQKPQDAGAGASSIGRSVGARLGMGSLRRETAALVDTARVIHVVYDKVLEKTLRCPTVLQMLFVDFCLRARNNFPTDLLYLASSSHPRRDHIVVVAEIVDPVSVSHRFGHRANQAPVFCLRVRRLYQASRDAELGKPPHSHEDRHLCSLGMAQLVHSRTNSRESSTTSTSRRLAKRFQYFRY